MRLLRHHTWLSMLAVSSLWAAGPVANKDELHANSKDLDIRVKIASKVPPAKPEDVHVVGNGALYAVSIAGRVIHVTADGKYMVTGDLFDLESKTNLSEENRTAARRAELQSIKDADAIIFEPDGPVKHSVTVFTDTDCTYCRKLHSEIAEINKLGIRVRYAAFPRTGPDTEAWSKTEAVWCSKDRRAALTRAKLGESVTAAKCQSPVASQFQIGQQMGARGTPMILTDDAKLVSGYLPPNQLAARLEELRKQSNEALGRTKH